MSRPIEDLTGRRFGRLVVLEELGRGKVRCICDCGNTVTVNKPYLKNGNTQSCGCLNRDISGNELAKISSHGGSAHIGRLKKNTAASRNTSGLRGVYFDKSRQKWAAEINVNGRKIHLGRYEMKEDAAKARAKAEEDFFQPLIESHEKEPTYDEYVGKRFGTWTVLSVRESKNGAVAFCRCDCGTEKDVRLAPLLNGLSKSCGCKRAQNKKGLT